MRFSIYQFIRSGLTAVIVMIGLQFNTEISNATELNVYSHRQPFLINPFLKEFEKQTGTKINVVFASKGLVQRLLAEGSRSPADVVLTVDIGRLYAYADKNLFAQVLSEKLSKNIPAHLRDKNNRWFGLSKRARIIAISKDRVGVNEIKRIEDLAESKWKGRICSRPGSHVYNRALLASMIAAHGEEKAEIWARKLVSNFARRPQGNDRAFPLLRDHIRIGDEQSVTLSQGAGGSVLLNTDTISSYQMIKPVHKEISLFYSVKGCESLANRLQLGTGNVLDRGRLALNFHNSEANTLVVAKTIKKLPINICNTFLIYPPLIVPSSCFFSISKNLTKKIDVISIIIIVITNSISFILFKVAGFIPGPSL